MSAVSTTPLVPATPPPDAKPPAVDLGKPPVEGAAADAAMEAAHAQVMGTPKKVVPPGLPAADAIENADGADLEGDADATPASTPAKVDDKPKTTEGEPGLQIQPDVLLRARVALLRYGAKPETLDKLSPAETVDWGRRVAKIQRDVDKRLGGAHTSPTTTSRRDGQSTRTAPTASDPDTGSGETDPDDDPLSDPLDEGGETPSQPLDDQALEAIDDPEVRAKVQKHLTTAQKVAAQRIAAANRALSETRAEQTRDRTLGVIDGLRQNFPQLADPEDLAKALRLADRINPELTRGRVPSSEEIRDVLTQACWAAFGAQKAATKAHNAQAKAEREGQPARSTVAAPPTAIPGDPEAAAYMAIQRAPDNPGRQREIAKQLTAKG